MSRAERCTACDDLRRQMEETRALTRQRDEARDCGQVGVCAIAPGCQRHWEERVREVMRERDEARAELAALRARVSP